ncbi:extensin [Neorhizobium lilium]|uniref:Extensin n=1 Tax=Neorhizobium lilium TaxID=2503024 RepID=A0A3S3VKE9_9HYPH|nr:extensin family protein [Neorhizobium lilium]RWX78675.1 extensin [Neorhizobium lilium]
MQHAWMAVLAGLPLLVGASPPPNRPIPQASQNQTQQANVVEVNFLDRLLQDNGGRRHSPATNRRTRTSQARPTAPSAPAVIPVPTPKPTTEADTSAPPVPATEPAAPAVATPVPETAPVTPSPSRPADQPASQPTTAPAPADQPEAPTVQQPATASEPAHEADVPKPLPKPADESPAPGKVEAPVANPAPASASPAEPTPAQPSNAEPPKPDQKPEEPAPPPPPPIATEDPEELKACLADLEALGTKFKPIDRIDDGEGCGIDKPIKVAEVLPGIDVGGAVMRCKTAQALGHWLKDTVQPAMSVAIPARRITVIVPGSTYACRLRNSAATGKISEHARGNGFDVAAFKFDNGEKMEMTPRSNDHTMEGAFQRTVTAGACLHFTTVLAPGSDASHETHMHLDVIDRNGGYRICE